VHHIEAGEAGPEAEFVQIAAAIAAPASVLLAVPPRSGMLKPDTSTVSIARSIASCAAVYRASPRAEHEAHTQDVDVVFVPVHVWIGARHRDDALVPVRMPSGISSLPKPSPALSAFFCVF
jgi:hypothetical protein